MPPTTDTSGPDLGIRLENNPAHYCPGDIILGHVYRTSPAKFSEATIDVSLNGLSISRIHGGEYVKEMNDWDCHLVYGDATKQQLFNGEINISNEQEAIQKWPFSITIPKNVDPRLGAHWNAPDDGEFLPLNAEAVQNVGLPPSFEMGHWRRCDEGIIDYYMQTELSFPGQNSLCSVKATFPLKIVCFNPGPPIADNKLQQRDKSLAVQSYSLAGLQKANLSRTQKLKKMLKSSSIPKFAFDLQTWIPTVLQIDNPGHVPLLLRVLPKRDETSESIRQMPQQLKLTQLEIGIDTVLQLKGLGTDDSVLTDKISLTGDDITSFLNKFELPMADKAPPANVGEALKLKLPPSDATHPLSPDILSYNVKLWHRFWWKATIQIAGESVSSNGGGVVIILPPSGENQDSLPLQTK